MPWWFFLKHIHTHARTHAQWVKERERESMQTNTSGILHIGHMNWNTAYKFTIISIQPAIAFNNKLYKSRKCICIYMMISITSSLPTGVAKQRTSMRWNVYYYANKSAFRQQNIIMPTSLLFANKILLCQQVCFSPTRYYYANMCRSSIQLRLLLLCQVRLSSI